VGITDRKERQKADLRDLILDAARKLFLEQGVEKTSIRNIADMIEYSPGTIYQYFKDKDDILHDLHHEGFVELGKRFHVLQSVQNPMDRLMAMGKEYIRFAGEHSDLYDLMFIMEAPINFLVKHEEEQWNEGLATFGALKNTVQDCMNAGHFSDHELEPLSYLIWSAVHGMVSLEIRRRNQSVIKCRPESIVSESYDEFLKIIKKL
jgi:AcrR family transcriptional regulator